MRMVNIQIKQNLIPKQVYIGDSAQLLCSFNSNSEILKALMADKDKITLPLENFIQDLDFTEYEIKEITLTKAGIDYYNLNLSFVPWRTGQLNFPDYRLFSENIENQEIIIVFEPFSISSLTEEKSITSIKDIEAPLLLPGTIYKFYGGIIVFIILLIIVIRLIVKHKKVIEFLRKRASIRKYRRNKKQALKQLNLLCKNKNEEDVTAAEKIQKIMRKYLDIRFDYPFSKTVTSQMNYAFEQINNQINNQMNNQSDDEENNSLSVFSEKKIAACKEITGAFEKTDFIRFSQEHDFKDEEKLSFIQKLIENIEILEEEENA